MDNAFGTLNREGDKKVDIKSYAVCLKGIIRQTNVLLKNEEET